MNEPTFIDKAEEFLRRQGEVKSPEAAATAKGAIPATSEPMYSTSVARVAEIAVANPVGSERSARPPEADASRSQWWLVEFADGTLHQVSTWPPASLAEVMHDYRREMANAVPIEEPLSQQHGNEERAEEW
jgi:hypothetical protein